MTTIELYILEMCWAELKKRQNIYTEIMFSQCSFNKKLKKSYSHGRYCLSMFGKKHLITLISFKKLFESWHSEKLDEEIGLPLTSH